MLILSKGLFILMGLKTLKRIMFWGLIVFWGVLTFGYNMAAAGDGADKTSVLADFENGTGGVFANVKGVIRPSQYLSGQALKLKNGQGISTKWGKRIDWPSFNFLSIDFYNPDDIPARLYFCFKDSSAPHGYYSWINRYFAVRPGKSTLEINLTQLQRGEGSPKDMVDPRPFNWNAVVWFGFSVRQGRVELDNIRLEKVEVPKMEGLWAFDFGPEGAPVLPGTVGVSPDTGYSDQVAYGWRRTGDIYSRKRINPPDSFVGDWISGNGCIFSIKVPNGTYQVWLMWEDPCEWELYQYYSYRRILAEGKKALEETMDGKEFLDRYFHFAEVEDFPGDDIYEKYVQWRYRPRTFTVEVADGRLDLTIQGSGQYAATVNGLIVYPVWKDKEGKKFIGELMERRKRDFHRVWIEEIPKRIPLDPILAKRASSLGCIVFRRGIRKDVGIFDVPKAEEAMAPAPIEGERRKTIRINAARGEYRPFTFSIHALRDLPKLKLTVGDFKSNKGHLLSRDAFEVRVTRYKFRRIGFSGGGLYGVGPLYLVNGLESSVRKGYTRRYWITVHVPHDQPGGIYRGKITLNGAGRPIDMDVETHVLPFQLPEADMGMGMFSLGNTAPYSSYCFPENKARQKADYERSLRFARRYGFTYLKVGGIRFKGFRDRKAQFDFSEPVDTIRLARKLGYRFIDLSGGGGIFRRAINDKGALARKHGFASADELVKELFSAAIRGAGDLGLPSPVWGFGDEPPETVAPRFLQIHTRIKKLSGAKSMLCWSPHGKATKKLLDVTSICHLNAATAAHFTRARKAGNTLYLNNQGSRRWAYGLYMWKAHQGGVQAYQTFAWLVTHGDPYYPLDGHEDESCRVFPDRQGQLRPVPSLARIREGITDYRYTLALYRAIAKTKTGPEAKKKVATEARQYLDDVFTRIKFENTRRDRRPQMTEEELSEYRRRVQDYLLKLLKPGGQ